MGIYKRRDPAYVGGWQMNVHVHLIVIIRGFKKLCSMVTCGLVGRGVCVRVRVMSLYPGDGGGGCVFFFVKHALAHDVIYFSCNKICILL